MTTEKKNLILDELQIDKFQNITKLAEKLKLPRTTLIHYINELSKEGLIIKEHGSVTKRAISYENKTNIKIDQNKKAKQAIAKVASSYIKDGDIIYIDSGSTTLFMIDFLKDKNIIIYTNNISLVEKLPVKGFKPKTFMVPGEIYMQTSSITGVLAINFLSKVFIDKAFVGTNSIKNRQYITTNPDEATLKENVIKNAKESFILFDKTKINSDDGKFIFAKQDNEKIKEVTK